MFSAAKKAYSKGGVEDFGHFGHLTKKTDIFDKSLISSKHLELELTVMSLLGYFRET